MVGSSIQDYLKVIYKLSLSAQRVAPSLVAQRLAVSPAAVTKMVRRLQELKLADHERNEGLTLTPAGEKIALEIIRHHRLIETYLKEALGYTWDQVDAEAEKLEHVISEEFEDKIDQLLGYPSHDPHGDPIPTKDGRIDQTRHATLSELESGQSSVICRVADRDPAMLRYLGKLGLYPAATVKMLDKAPYDGPLRVSVDDTEQVIGRELANHVFVAVVT